MLSLYAPSPLTAWPGVAQLGYPVSHPWVVTLDIQRVTHYKISKHGLVWRSLDIWCLTGDNVDIRRCDNILSAVVLSHVGPMKVFSALNVLTWHQISTHIASIPLMSARGERVYILRIA